MIIFYLNPKWNCKANGISSPSADSKFLVSFVFSFYKSNYCIWINELNFMRIIVSQTKTKIFAKQFFCSFCSDQSDASAAMWFLAIICVQNKEWPEKPLKNRTDWFGSFNWNTKSTVLSEIPNFLSSATMSVVDVQDVLWMNMALHWFICVPFMFFFLYRSLPSSFAHTVNALTIHNYWETTFV